MLPFHSGSAADESLVSGIWDDTRQALSANPQLVVLGPHTSQELAERGTRTARKAADYFLEGHVQSAGSRIRVNVSLTRSSDGVQIWSETFDRPLDDIFAVQSAIAAEIEGHIRGRLAQRGGIRPENIATSGEVYALYSDATAKLRDGSYQDGYDAYRQLQQVVNKDPNYAPGWAALSIAGWYTIYDTDDAPVPRDLSEAQARRAIAAGPQPCPGACGARACAAAGTGSAGRASPSAGARSEQYPGANLAD